MNKFKLGVVSGLAAMSLTVMAPAMATSIVTFNLDQISSSSIGSGSLGTVVLTQNGANEVDVNVTLAANTGFIQTGTHTSFSWNLSSSVFGSSVVTLTNPSSGFSFGTTDSGNTIKNPPYGTFTDGFKCTLQMCGNGGSNPYYATLGFTVTNTGGISLADFMANSGGYYFAADVLGPNGGTGAIASNSGIASSVPEPSTYAMLLAGLGLIGFIALRKKRGGAMNFA